MSNFETALLEETVFSNLNATNNKFLLGSALNKATKKGTNNTNFGGFGRDFLKLNDPVNTYQKIVEVAKKEMLLYNKQYTKTEFDTIISDRNTIINNNVKNNLYKNLYNANISPRNYSLTLTTGKIEPISVFTDIISNKNYYCDIGVSLKSINDTIKIIKPSKNSFSGMIDEFNKKISKTDLGVDFNGEVPYGNGTVKALTFNNLIKEQGVFNVLPKPIIVNLSDIFQKYI
jgi:hypothetical protein